MHYRKLKKVPATGWVEEKTIRERGNACAEKQNSADTGATVIIPAKKQADDTATVLPGKTLYNNHGYKFPILQKKTMMRPRHRPFINKYGYKFPAAGKRRESGRHGDGSVFLVFLFLFIGLGLIITGVTMIIIGVNSIIWWLILLGLVVIFLGLMPFLGMISLAMGDRYRPSPAYDEEPKKSFFPDHQ